MRGYIPVVTFLKVHYFTYFRIVDHPQYRRCCNYDISLLQMCNGFNLPSISNAVPACLPSRARPENVDVKTIQHGRAHPLSDITLSSPLKVLISGWGSLRSGGGFPNLLQKATVTLHANSYCQSQYGSRFTNPSNCASASGRDTCQVKLSLYVLTTITSVDFVSKIG